MRAAVTRKDTRPTGAASGSAAETVLKLAVLLQAGVAPARAWSHLAEAGDPCARRVVTAMADGMPLAAAIAAAGDPRPEAAGETGAVSEPGGGHGPAACPPPGPDGRPRGGRDPDAPPRREKARRRDRADHGAQRTAPGLRQFLRLLGRRGRGGTASDADAWRDIAAAWRVATTVGAPLAESLRGLAAALRDAQEAADDVRVALAEPAATARLMGWLPLVAVGLGAVLGFDTFGVLLGQPIGIVCLLAGAALIVAAQRWSSRMVRRAQADGAVPGLETELLAIALSGGVSIDRATSIVRQAGVIGDGGADVLALSRSAGIPAVELLRASAAHARHRARVEGRLRAARLSSRLLIPLGVCTLPAFLLLGVAPMLLSVMSAVPLSL